jgi:hypothetical protein
MAGGMRGVGGDEVTRVISHRKAAVAAGAVVLDRVFIVDGGVEGEDKGICVEHVSRGGVEPTHYLGSEGDGAVNPVFGVTIVIFFARGRLVS